MNTFAVKKHQKTVFAVQQEIAPFINALYVVAKKLSKGHDLKVRRSHPRRRRRIYERFRLPWYRRTMRFAGTVVAICLP
jgi:hypothetical protein